MPTLDQLLRKIIFGFTYKYGNLQQERTLTTIFCRYLNTVPVVLQSARSSERSTFLTTLNDSWLRTFLELLSTTR
jgi:hypothetical protein